MFHKDKDGYTCGRQLRFHKTDLVVDFFKDLWGYFKVRRKFWLAPLILIVVFCALILLFGGATGVTPFIYSLF